METTFDYKQQERGNMYLCVDGNYRNEFFSELKRKIQSQFEFLKSIGTSKVFLTQSPISESCYIELLFESGEWVKIRISSHYNPFCANDFEYIINEPKNIKNEFHFNKTLIFLLKKHEIN